MDPRRARTFALLSVAVAAAALAPGLLTGRPDWPPDRWALAAGLVAVSQAALFALGDGASARRRAVLAGLSLLALAALSVLDSNVALPPVLFALGILGARLPVAWVRALALPVTALLLAALWAGATVRWPEALVQEIGFLGVVALGASVRRQRVLADELREANRALAARAEEAEELARLRERERLARDLHDTLGHALSTLAVQLEAGRRLARRDPERTDALLGEARDVARGAMRDLRETLDDLRGAPGALPGDLRALAGAEAARHGWTLDLDVEDVPLPPQAEDALRRAAREMLANVARHARARRVAVALRADAADVRLAVRDDGAGFDAARDPEGGGHYGLRGLRERASLLGGRLAVDSAPGHGTAVELSVPLRAPGGGAA